MVYALDYREQHWKQHMPNEELYGSLIKIMDTICKRLVEKYTRSSASAIGFK